jgi:hypothetical protein
MVKRVRVCVRGMVSRKGKGAQLEPLSIHTPQLEHTTSTKLGQRTHAAATLSHPDEIAWNLCCHCRHDAPDLGSNSTELQYS